MIHGKMIHHMEKQRRAHDHDSLEAALLDWIYLGRFVGYRSIEWCQQHHHKFQTIENRLWTGPTCYAFIDEDFQFFTSDKQPIYDKTTLTWDSIGYVIIRFRKQKINRNYEVVSYFRDTINPAFCPVHAALRICQRATRLGVPPDEPLGVYFSTQGRYAQQRCHITNHQVATFLRATATVVFKLKATDPILSRWSAHSIRVTACNLLHRQGFSDTYIQTRLRWSSNAFLGYLRNTIYTSRAHTKALHIPPDNLPALTNTWDIVDTAHGNQVRQNSPNGTPITRHRKREELEQVLHAGAA